MSRAAHRCILALAILASLLGGHAAAQQAETLADVLARNSIATGTASIPRLYSRITSYEVLNDPDEFVIGYYLDRDDQRLDFPLFLSRLDKRTGEWRNAEVKDIKVSDPDEASGETFNADCLGSITNLEHKADRYFLDLHWNPSAGCLLILHDNFTLDTSLPGWSEALLKGAVLWQHNMVHFASTHLAQLWFYDPAARHSQRVYPQPDDPLRQDFKRRLAAVTDQEKCRKNNWSCDPEEFSSDIGTVEANEQTGAFAVQITFYPEGFLTREEAGNSAWSRDEYVYVYRLNPFAWRAFSFPDLKLKFGTDSLRDILTPEKLAAVFTEPR